MINLHKYPSIFIANWKLNGNLSFLKEYFEKLKVNSNNCTVICPPSIYLNTLININTKSIFVGSQDVSIHKEGAYTGELSSKMLVDNNVNFCLVGHSERRQLFSETNINVKKKCINLIEEKIIPVICIGETLEEKQKNLTEKVLLTQIKESIPVISNDENTIIAYEPIWAIGTGLTPTFEEIDSVHSMIKSIEKKFKNYKILYGGSVKSSNSSKINALQNVDGCLIGGASLKVDEFNIIIS